MRNRTAEAAYLKHSFLKNLKVMMAFALILLTIIMIFGYVVQKNEMKSTAQGISMMTNTLNREVDRLFNVLSVINDGSGIRQIKTMGEFGRLSDYYLLSEAVALATRSFAALESVENYFISFRQCGLVLSSRGNFLDDDAYYLLYNFPLRYIEGTSDASCFLYPCPKYTVLQYGYSGNTSPAVLDMTGAFCVCAHFQTPGRMDAVLVIKDSFMKELYPYDFENGCSVTIRSNDGTLLYSYGSQSHSDIEWSICESGNLFSVEASFAPWTIVSRLRYPILICLGLTIASIGLCLALAWRLTHAKYVTIRPIISSVQSGAQIAAQGEERLINSFIDSVNADRDQSRAMISVMRRSLRRNMQMMLFNGVVDLPPEILGEFPKSYRIVYGYMESAGESIPLVDRLLLEQLMHEMPGKLEPYYLSESAFAFIYPTNDPNREKDEDLEKLSTRLSDGVRLIYSAVCEKPKDAYKAFEQMRRATLSRLQMNETRAAQPIEFRHMEELYQSLSYDDADEVKRHMIEYINRSLDQGKPLREVYLQLCSIIDFAGQSCGYDASELPAYSVSLRPQELVDDLIDTVTDMCNWRDAKRQRFDSERRREIIGYIKAQLSDQNLTVQQVGEVYGLSEHAVQSVLKEETNLSFVAYLQKIRLEESLNMLAADSMPVYAISEACGFSTLSTFQKAFKRMYGIAPGEWRRHARERNAFSGEAHEEKPGPDGHAN